MDTPNGTYSTLTPQSGHQPASGEQSARPRSRRSRQRMSGPDKAIVTVVIVALGLIAAFYADAAPTSVSWVDAVQRSIVVVVVALAGLRARRWSLVSGAALVAVFSTGFAVLIGLAVLLTTVVLTFIDKRSRVLGCAIGGVVALLSLSLKVPGPLGTETLVALLATVPIIISGYGIYVSTRSHRRRRIRQILLIAVVVVIGSLVATAVATATSWRHIRTAMSSVQSGLSAAERGDQELSAEEFRSANASFVQANRIVGSNWAALGQVLPVVGVNLTAVRASVQSGEMLTERAGTMLGDLDFSNVQMQGGGVDLAELAEFKAPLQDTTRTLRQVTDTLSAMTSPWLLPPLADKIDELTGKVDSAARQSETALLAVEKSPAILGAGTPRHYLFLFGNPAEMRDLGGHLGNWAEIVADNGKLHLVRVGGPLDLVIPADRAPKDLTGRFPASLVEMDPTRFPHNWSSSRDLPTVAKLAAELFPIATGQKLDGVVYADVNAFAALLRLTGPVAVPDLDPPLELNQANAAEFLTRGQFERFASESAAGDSLEKLIKTMFDKLTSTRLPDPQELGDLFAPLVENGRFRMATVHDGDTDLLTRLGLIGSIKVISGRDMLAVINRNAGPSKIDSYLTRGVNADITWNPETGGVQSKVTVDLHNAAPSTGLNRTIYGNDASIPDGTNLTDVAVLSPLRLQEVRVDGKPAASHPLKEDSFWRYTVRVAIPPGGNRVIVFDLDGRVDPGPNYVLSFNGQSLLNPGNAVIRVKSTVGRATVAGEPNTRINKGSVKLGESLDKTVVWRSEGS